MATTTTYQCPNCSGRLTFDGAAGKLRCEFCDSLFTPEEIEELYADKQAKADEAATTGSSVKSALAMAAEAGIDTSTLDRRQKNAITTAYDNAIATGKTAEEIKAAVVAAAAAAADAPREGASAAEASTSAATHVTPAKTELTGDPIQDYIAQSKWDPSETEGLRAFNCPACGAQLLVDQVTAVTSCPYCGNNAVVPGQLSDVLKPDYVIPFKLDRDAAVAALKEYYGGKPLLPDSFTANNHIEEVQGVYVPFWLYSGTVEARASFDGTNTRTWTDTKNQYTDTDHFDVYREGTVQFHGVPVDGSTRMPDAHMDAIEPYDYNEMVPFSVGYLPGYVTDRYDLDVEQCDARARRRAENTAIGEIETTVTGYMSTSLESHSADAHWTDIAYALLPVWMLHTKWNGDDYLFAMNGQTGKLIGDLPVDKGKKTKRFLMVFLPFMIILAAIIFVVFGLF